MTPDRPEPVATLRATLIEALGRIAGDHPGAAPFALGWATVELDRAERAFTETFGASAHAAIQAPDDRLLGAFCRILALDPPGLTYVVLLEPSTEGRLTATLARHGEGPAAAWLAPVPLDDPAATSSRPSGSVGAGPFGPQILLPGDPITGPHRLLVPAGPGTITP
jgi:hypothetical protein